MTTITASTTIGVHLTSATFVNPVLVNPGVTISTTGDAIAASAGSWTLQNKGRISGAGAFANGIDLSAGGAVTNFATGLVTGSSDGVRINGAAGVVVNYGSIAGLATGPVYYGFGVDLQHGGAITNKSGGTISGYASGINVYGAAGTVINAGMISGHNYNGVILRSGGAVTNQAGGTISGSAYGVLIRGAAGTAVNAGVISGGIGLYVGGAVTNQVGGTIVGSASKLGVYVTGGAATVVNAGSIGGGISFAGAYTNLLVADPGAVFAGNVNGGSVATSELELAAGGAGSLTGLGTQIINFGSIVFDAGATWFLAGNTAGLSGTISGFAVGDTIDLTGVTATGSSYSGGILTIQEAGGSATLHLPGAFTTASFSVVPVAGGTDISLSTLCFLRDTVVATPNGQVPVQSLAIGDLVMTASGIPRPITWIGTGRVLANPRQRSAATPVVIRKGALDDNVPNRDLRVTKGHSLFIDNVLIPVEFLMNHRSIAWDDFAREVELYHIELETHDVLIANGALAESYRDDGNRWLFRNANDAWGLAVQEPCAEIMTGGPAVDEIWRRLLWRAGPRPGLPLTDESDLHLLVDGERVDGTARDDGTFAFDLPRELSSARIVSRAGVPQELGLARDDRMLGVAVCRIEIAAARWRRAMDADAASLADGYHAYEPDNGVRWTNGNAAIPAELFSGMPGPATLKVVTGARTRYLDDGRIGRVA
jgi:hypothetical protein